MNPLLILPLLLISHPSDWGDKVLLAVQVEKPPILDGSLSDKAWSKTRPASGFTQKYPDEGKPPTEKTFVYCVYDNENLYFAFDCWDSHPEKLEAKLTPREPGQPFGESIAILLDTYHDHRTAFEFQTNPFGVQVDSRRTEDGANRDYSWDGVWEAEGMITRKGWSAEIKIPFKTLRFIKQEKMVWGVNFWRYIYRKSESTWWSPVTRADGRARVSKYGHVVILRDILPGHHVEILPYITSQAKKSGIPTSGDLELKWDFTTTGDDTVLATHSGGVDLKWGITSNLIADLTLNPDFGEVEADREVINLTRYPIYFEERRPFFTERKDFFHTPLELFYSRRIGILEDGTKARITGGLKVTGKVGGTSIGIIGAGTEGTSNIEETEFEPRSAYSAIRLKQDAFKNSSVGFLFASKDAKGFFGRTGGVDLNFNFLETFNLTGQIARTWPQTEGDEGWAGEMKIEKTGTLFDFVLNYRDIDSRFDASSTGFVPWRGTKMQESWVTFHPRPRQYGVRDVKISVGGARDRLYMDNEWSQGGWGELNFGFENEWSFYGGSWLGSSYIIEVDSEFNTYSFWTGITTDWRKPLFFDISGSQNREFNFQRFEFGRSRQFGIYPDLSLFGNFSMRMGIQNTREYNESGTIYIDGSTWISSQRIQYTLTRDLSLSLFVQENVQENTDTHKFSFNRSTFNGLIEWRYYPGSIIYLAYNDIRDYFEDKEDQILLIKVAYLFRL
jgi:hypothetical protein